MIVRLSTPAQRLAILFLGLALALSLSYFGIRSALATHFAGQETLEGFQRATTLEPANPKNWFRLGHYWQFNLENPDLDKAIQAYRVALSIDPGSADTWADLGTAYETDGKIPEARDAFTHAKKAYPSSANTAWLYGNFLLRQNELGAAFSEFHQAVQADPELAPQAFSRALRVGVSPLEIVNRVVPPSRNGYLGVVRDLSSSQQVDIALLVWDRLVALQPRIELRDSSELFGALQQRGRVADAKRVWNQTTALAGFADLFEPADSVLWDGGFESGSVGWGYSWTYPPLAHGVDIRLDSQEKHSGKFSLRLTFDGRRDLNFQDVCHRVPVEPSRHYRLSAWVRPQSITTDQGVRLALWALDVQDRAPLTTPDVRGTHDWFEVESLWTAPRNAQEMQVCLVRYPSGQVDNKIKGTLWIDDVALVPLNSESSKP
jgi:tetratricopeptide (TPR) repeat protein